MTHAGATSIDVSIRRKSARDRVCSRGLRRAPGEDPRPLHGHPVLGVEVAQQALELAEAGEVERVQVESVVAPLMCCSP